LYRGAAVPDRKAINSSGDVGGKSPVKIGVLILYGA